MRPQDSVGGFKGDSSFLAEALGGKWSGREKAYIMSPKASERMRGLIREGYSADIFGRRIFRRRNGKEELAPASLTGRKRDREG